MLRGVAGFPGCIPLIGADARVQVIGADDLAETVAGALKPDAPAKVVWDVAHPHVHALADIVVSIRAWLGLAPRRLLRLPSALGKAVALAADAVGWLGWRSPARTTSFAALTAGVVGDPAAWMAATGIRPRSLRDILAARPAGVQDRWFARLYFLKPLAILGLACTAIASGLPALISASKLAVMVMPGISPGVFTTRVLPGFLSGAVALIAGVAMLVRRTARAAVIALLILAVLQALDQLVAAFRLGLNPFAALPFDIPVLLATLFTLAILDER
jgi:hypothetical protein